MSQIIAYAVISKSQLMKILNLGKIQPDNTLLMVDLPKYAIRKRGRIYPLDIKECQKYGDLEVCRWPSFLHFDFCLSSIYNKTIQERCNLIQKMNDWLEQNNLLNLLHKISYFYF